MKLLTPLILVSALSSFYGAVPARAADEWKQPHPHSSGAELLPYCQQTDAVISQLRCDYYVQGVADLATFPVKGAPLACIPKGLNRTELMQLTTEYLASLEPSELEQKSAASLILKELKKKFPCPKKAKPGMSKSMVNAMKRRLEAASKEKAE
jgi:hypothetical protein